MYQVQVRIQGTASLLQHRFAPEQLDSLLKGATKKAGTTDYSLEWLETMYATADGHLYQPATHIEGALVEAAGRFKIKGARGRTWRDPIRAYCYVAPAEILHLYDNAPVPAPGADLLQNPTEHLRVDVRQVRISRAAVARSRLLIAEGWELAFVIEVHEDQVEPPILRTILEEAGRAVGIGDFRPRYGRFAITDFSRQ